jgi:hypothetical protein
MITWPSVGASRRSATGREGSELDLDPPSRHIPRVAPLLARLVDVAAEPPYSPMTWGVACGRLSVIIVQCRTGTLSYCGDREPRSPSAVSTTTCFFKRRLLSVRSRRASGAPGMPPARPPVAGKPLEQTPHR